MIDDLDLEQTYLAFLLIRRVARNLQWRPCVTGVWGRSPQPPEAIGSLGAEPPAAGGTWVWGQSPQC